MPVITSDICKTVMVYSVVGNQKHEVANDGTIVIPNLMKIHQFVQMSLEGAYIYEHAYRHDNSINPSFLFFFLNTAHTCKKQWHCHTCYLKERVSQALCARHTSANLFLQTLKSLLIYVQRLKEPANAGTCLTLRMVISLNHTKLGIKR
jgi:hypothetical protein